MRLFSLSVVTLVLATSAMAQDLVTIAPKNAKVEYEDARVRVVRLRMAPHDSTPMQDRPSRVVIGLTASTARLTSPDGSTHTVKVPAGNVGWGGPTRRSVENLDTSMENVIVEIKDATEPAVPVKQPPSADDPRALVEPHHKWLFENQYVRVYDVRIPAGEMTEFHKHAYDSVGVHLSDGLTSAQLQGAEWMKPHTAPSGSVQFSPDSKKPFTHRVRNEGAHEYHVVVVQIK